MAQNEFPDLVKKIIEQRLEDVWTCIPAIVISVDYAKHTCDIKPKMKSPSGADYPILQQVPIIKAGGGMFLNALKRDDVVLALFSKVALTELLKDKKTASVGAETREFNINDCVVIGGLFTDVDTIPAYAEGEMVLAHSSGSSIRFKANGNIEITAQRIDFIEM